MNFNDDDSILYQDDSMLRPPPFTNFNPQIPNPPGFPGGPNFPGGQNFPGGPNFPGGQNQGSNLNIGPPPNFTPSKNSPGVNHLSQGPSTGPQTKLVSPGSISFCLFKFTYIWERGGRNYWAFLLNVDRRSVSGLRWFRRRWVFFGVDLNRIDSFICYRSEVNDKAGLRKESLISTKKEFTTDNIKNTYSKVLASVEIPEERNDFFENYLGEVDGNDLTVKVPCKQRRTVSYRIVLEIKYPESFNKDLIGEINSIAFEASKEAVKSLDEFRDSKHFLTPLEVFNTSAKNIGKSIKVFSDEFTNKLKKLKLPRETSKEIEYTIIQEKIEEPWRIV